MPTNADIALRWVGQLAADGGTQDPYTAAHPLGLNIN